MIVNWVWRNIHWVQPQALASHTELTEKVPIRQIWIELDDHAYEHFISVFAGIELVCSGLSCPITSLKSLSLLTNTGNTDLVLQHVLLLLLSDSVSALDTWQFVPFHCSLCAHLGQVCLHIAISSNFEPSLGKFNPIIPELLFFYKCTYMYYSQRNLQIMCRGQLFSPPHCKFCYVSRRTCMR